MHHKVQGQSYISKQPRNPSHKTNLQSLLCSSCLLYTSDAADELLGVGASMYTTILKVTLPSAFRSIATGVVLGIARAAGETAPLIFTALFSYYYITGFGDLFYEMGSLAVLIYNFALEPYDAQNKLAWAASFILVLSILSVNIFSRILAAFTEKTKRL